MYILKYTLKCTMDYITTTQLRTESSRLIEALLAGRNVDIIHRSKVVGEISPKKPTSLKVIDSQQLQKKIERLGLPSLTVKEMDRRYRAAMTKKHGQGLS